MDQPAARNRNMINAMTHTTGQWYAMTHETGGMLDQATVFSERDGGSEPIFIADTWSVDDEIPLEERKANAKLIAAAGDLLEAAQLLEAAEDSRQHCDECDDEGEPEACGKCFPKFDDARLKRRAAIAKATGGAHG